MAVFPILKTESKVQVGDKIRLDASKTFISQGEFPITKVEIEAHTGDGFVDVTDLDQSQWFLDWAFLTDGTKTSTLRITTTDETGPTDFVTQTTLDIEAVTAVDDMLFSNDNDLKVREHDILNWLPAGFSSWNHVHRQAQKNILDWLDEIRIYKRDGTRYEAQDIFDKEQVRRISTLTTLRMIYWSISNATDDKFLEKYREYLKLETEAKNRNQLLVDFFGNGDPVRQDLRTTTLLRV